MDSNKFEIEYYDLPDGTYPAFDFIISPKTPPAEIDRAKKYRAEYLSR